jgi:hypothetical protein
MATATVRKDFDVSAADVRRGDVPDKTPVSGEKELPQFLSQNDHPKGLGDLNAIRDDIKAFKTAAAAALAASDPAEQRFSRTLAVNYEYNRLLALVKSAQPADAEKAKEASVAKLRPQGQAAGSKEEESSLMSSSDVAMLERSVSDIGLLQSKAADTSGEALTVVAQEATIKQLFVGDQTLPKEVGAPERVSKYLREQATGRRLVVVKDIGTTKKDVSPSFLALTTTKTSTDLELYRFRKPVLNDLGVDRRYQLGDQGGQETNDVVSEAINTAKFTKDLTVVRVPTSPLLFQGNGFPFPLREAVSDLRIVIAQQANLGDPSSEKDRFLGREFITPIAIQFGPLPDFADRNAESVLLRLIVGFLPIFQYQAGAAGGETAAADARDLKAMLKVYMHSRELLGFSMIKRTILNPELIDQDEKGEPKDRVKSLEAAYAAMADHTEAMLRAARWKIGEKKGYLSLAPVAGRKPMTNDVRAFFLNAALGKSIDAKSTDEIRMMAEYPDMTLLLVETLRPAALRMVQQDTSITDATAQYEATNELLIKHLKLDAVFKELNWQKSVVAIAELFVTAADVKDSQQVDTAAMIKAAADAFLLGPTKKGSSPAKKKKEERAAELKKQTAEMTEEKLGGEESVRSERLEQLASAAATLLSDGAISVSVSVDEDRKERELEAQVVGALAADAIAKSTDADTEKNVTAWTLRTMSDMKNYTALFTDAVRRANNVPEREIKFLLIRLLRSLPLLGTEIPGGAQQIEERIAKDFAEVTPIVAEYLAMRLWDDYFLHWKDGDGKENRVAFAEWPYAGLVKLAQLIRRPKPLDTDPEALPSIAEETGVNAKVFDEFVTKAIGFLVGKQKEQVKDVSNPAFVDEKAVGSGAPSLVFWGRSTPYTIGVSDMRAETVYLEFQPFDKDSAETVFKKHLLQERDAYKLIVKSKEYAAIVKLAETATKKTITKLGKSSVALHRLLDYILRSEPAAMAAQRIRKAGGISWKTAEDIPAKAFGHLRDLVQTAILIASDQVGKEKAEDTRLLVNYDTLAAAVSIDSVLASAHEMAKIVMDNAEAPADDETFERRKKAILNKTIDTLLSTHYKTQKLAADLGSEHATAYRVKLNMEIAKAQALMIKGNGRKRRSSSAAAKPAPAPLEQPAATTGTQVQPAPRAPLSQPVVPVSPPPPNVSPSIPSLPSSEEEEGEEQPVSRLGAPATVQPAPASPRVVVAAQQQEGQVLLARIQSLETEKARLEGSIKSIGDQLGTRDNLGELVRRLKLENERFKLAADQAQQAGATGAQSQAQLALLIAERDQLLQRVKEAELDLKAAEDAREKLQKQIDALNETALDQQAEIDTEKQKRLRAEDVAHRAEEELKKERAKRVQDVARADGLQRDKDDLEQQLDAAKGSMSQQQALALQTVQGAQRQRVEGVVVSGAVKGLLRDILLTQEGLMPFFAFAGLKPRFGQLPSFPNASVASQHYLIVHFFNEQGHEVLAVANRNAYVEFLAQESTAKMNEDTCLFVARTETIIGITRPGEQSTWIYVRHDGEGNEWRKLDASLFVPRVGSVTVEYHVEEEMARRLDASVLRRRSVSFHYRVPTTEWAEGSLAVARLENQDFTADSTARENDLFARVVIHQAPREAQDTAPADMMKLDLILPFLILCTAKGVKAL